VRRGVGGAKIVEKPVFENMYKQRRIMKSLATAL
jgi:hypothetical protein